MSKHSLPVIALADKPMTVLAKPATARRDLLQRALRATDLGPRARDVFVAHPRAREVFERMAWFMTDKPMHPVGRPLFHVAVLHAFRCLQHIESLPTATREDRLVALYAGLFRVLPALNEVYVVGAGETWDPLVGIPLGEWLSRHDPVSISLGEPADAFAEKSPAAFRAGIASHILDAADVADIGGRLDQVLDYSYA